MKYVNAGNERIPLISLIAILSISLTVNLPGLAISPIMGKLNQVFTHVSDLEIQLLTVLPNLVTIPFILCSGKICTPRNQTTVLSVGLVIFSATGILYFFAKTMVQLIILSCLLGVGCGLVIPLAASMVSQHFSGEQRTRQLGNKSSLSNFTIIFATLFVGWIAKIDWHLAFSVYLVALIPLFLVPFMRQGFIKKHTLPSARKAISPALVPEKKHPGIKTKNTLITLVGVMALYLGVTYGAEVVSYNLPFTMQTFGFSTGNVGVATSMFFIGATLSGFMLTHILRLLGRRAILISLAVCAAGLFLTAFLHAYWAFIAGVLLLGLGYGAIQPIIYDKTSSLADAKNSSEKGKSTAYFSYLLTCNYIGIAIVPFVIKGAADVFRAGSSATFPFIFNGAVMIAILILGVVKCRSYVFDVPRAHRESAS